MDLSHHVRVIETTRRAEDDRCMNLRHWMGSKVLVVLIVGLLIIALGAFEFTSRSPPHRGAWTETECTVVNAAFYHPCRHDFECNMCLINVDFEFVPKEQSDPPKPPEIVRSSVTRGVKQQVCSKFYPPRRRLACYYRTTNNVKHARKTLVDGDTFDYLERRYADSKEGGLRTMSIGAGLVALYLLLGLCARSYSCLATALPCVRFFRVRTWLACCVSCCVKTRKQSSSSSSSGSGSGSGSGGARASVNTSSRVRARARFADDLIMGPGGRSVFVGAIADEVQVREPGEVDGLEAPLLAPPQAPGQDQGQGAQPKKQKRAKEWQKPQSFNVLEDRFFGFSSPKPKPLAAAITPASTGVAASKASGTATVTGSAGAGVGAGVVGAASTTSTPRTTRTVPSSAASTNVGLLPGNASAGGAGPVSGPGAGTSRAPPGLGRTSSLAHGHPAAMGRGPAHGHVSVVGLSHPSGLGHAPHYAPGPGQGPGLAAGAMAPDSLPTMSPGMSLATPARLLRVNSGFTRTPSTLTVAGPTGFASPAAAAAGASQAATGAGALVGVGAVGHVHTISHTTHGPAHGQSLGHTQGILAHSLHGHALAPQGRSVVLPRSGSPAPIALAQGATFAFTDAGAANAGAVAQDQQQQHRLRASQSFSTKTPSRRRNDQPQQ